MPILRGCLTTKVVVSLTVNPKHFGEKVGFSVFADFDEMSTDSSGTTEIFGAVISLSEIEVGIGSRS